MTMQSDSPAVSKSQSFSDYYNDSWRHQLSAGCRYRFWLRVGWAQIRREKPPTNAGKSAVRSCRLLSPVH